MVALQHQPHPSSNALPQPFPTTRYELASGPTGEHFRFATSARSADGRFRFVWTLAPGKGGPGEHSHPRETEAFEIVSGTLRIWMDGVATDYGPGERVAIPPGKTHRFLNPLKVPLVTNVTCDGPLLEDVFVPFAVANDKKPSLSNFLRFMVTTSINDGSVPTPGLALTIATAVVSLIKLCGVKPFEPVYGWDKQA